MGAKMDQGSGIRRVVAALWQGWCLQCPNCGEKTLFRGWFNMYDQCRNCQLTFEREQGYFLGAMYINYALTVGLVLLGYFLLEWYTHLSLMIHIVLWGGASLLFPLLLYRRSRGVWLALDYLVNPVENQKGGGPGDASGSRR